MAQTDSTIARLKDEGNALFLQKKYGPAIAKYSEAIALNDTNAVIYANRAACRMALRMYMDALSDATKATELNPSYAKAWGRKGAALDALGKYNLSIEAWKRALDVLPKENLSPSDLKQKEQYESSLNAAIEALEPTEGLPPRAHEINPNEGKMPWDVACEMIDAAKQEGIDHCGGAWVIYNAWKDFKQGLQIMENQREIHHGDQITMIGNVGAVQAISNAVLVDERVFAIYPQEWLRKFDRQTMAELGELGGWANEGPEVIKKEALARLQKKGWNDLRPALSLTIRLWIMQGFLMCKMPMGPTSYGASVEYLRRALEMIDWGRDTWKSVPKTTRGVVFDLTFRRGVWNMLLNSLEEEFAQNQGNTELLETIYNEAQGLIDDVEANPLDYKDYDVRPGPAFVWAFFRAPLGNALAAQGLYHVHKANASADAQEERDHWFAAGRCYRDAALRGFAEDDSHYPWFLRCAYMYWLPCEPPTRDMLDILEKIQISLPKVRMVWHQNRSYAKSQMNREKEYTKLQTQEKRVRRLISAGLRTMEDPFQEVDK